MPTLSWPDEKVGRQHKDAANWFHRGSNYCQDFHGDPVDADLVVYSDGNHHMALRESLEQFRLTENLDSIFYCTLPPGVYLNLMRDGYLDLGNLRISNAPDLVIGPDKMIRGLQQDGKVDSGRAFIRSAGNSLLVAKNNPRKIESIDDLFRPDVRLFISSPQNEPASYQVYRDSIAGLALASGIDEEAINARFSASNPATLFGEKIHHREAPEAVASGGADVAMLYHHLALHYTRLFTPCFDLVALPFGGDNLTTVYHCATTAGCKAPATELQRFLLCDQNRGIYERHGLVGI